MAVDGAGGDRRPFPRFQLVDAGPNPENVGAFFGIDKSKLMGVFLGIADGEAGIMGHPGHYLGRRAGKYLLPQQLGLRAAPQGCSAHGNLYRGGRGGNRRDGRAGERQAWRHSSGRYGGS